MHALTYSRCIAEVRADAAGLSTGNSSSIDSVPGGSELSVKDRETARRNFKRVNSMQREQLGLGGQPLPDAPLPEGITPEQLFPGNHAPQHYQLLHSLISSYVILHDTP